MTTMKQNFPIITTRIIVSVCLIVSALLLYIAQSKETATLESDESLIQWTTTKNANKAAAKLYKQEQQISTTATVSNVGGATLSSHLFGENKKAEELSLTVGDLPGYTGWARPSYTLSRLCGMMVINNNNSDNQSFLPYNYPTLTLRVECRKNNDNATAQSLFYMRAYGPSLIAGRVTSKGAVDDDDGGTGYFYDISFDLWDAGMYNIEVVMTYSNISATPFESFPLGPDSTEPAYEGYLVPGFPLVVTVNVPTAKSPATPPKQCDLQNLMIPVKNGSDDSGAIRPNWNVQELGRWKVVNRNGIGIENDKDLEHDATEVSLQGYQTGRNSIGFQMDYFFRDCFLPTRRDASKLLWRTAAAAANQKKSIHIIFVGDSNMRNQHAMFDALYVQQNNNNSKKEAANVETYFVPTNDGLILRMSDIKESLIDIMKHIEKRSHAYILFNSGLHDIAKLCSRRFAYMRSNEEPCLDVYRKALTDLVVFIKALSPPALSIFESTTAAWPKWGNYGFTWPPDKAQTLPLDTKFCEIFNQIAFDIMAEHTIPVIDAYWMTLSRPDHREVKEENSIGQHMVHAGREVYDVLLREWTTIIVNHHTKANSN